MSNPGACAAEVPQCRQETATSPLRKWPGATGSQYLFQHNRRHAKRGCAPTIAKEIVDCSCLRMPVTGNGPAENQSRRQNKSAKPNSGGDVSFLRNRGGNAAAKFQREPEQEESSGSDSGGEEVVRIRKTFAEVSR